MPKDSQIEILRQEIELLKTELNRNNFVGSQDFNKSSRFNTTLKVPHYDTIPRIAEVGEIIEVGGKLYICSSQNTFSLVGTQT